jgi:RES domain-containing protein
VLVFRIGSSRYPAHDGKGASLYGGRWNHKGTAVIYTAESRALCALEVLANADELADDYMVTPIEMLDQVTMTRLYISELPVNWDAGEPTNATRDIGAAWTKGLSTAVLAVPSAVIPREWNFILNPAHPAFSGFQFLEAEPFYFDDRLGRAWVKKVR